MVIITSFLHAHLKHPRGQVFVVFSFFSPHGAKGPEMRANNLEECSGTSMCKVGTTYSDKNASWPASKLLHNSLSCVYFSANEGRSAGFSSNSASIIHWPRSIIGFSQQPLILLEKTSGLEHILFMASACKIKT